MGADDNIRQHQTAFTNRTEMINQHKEMQISNIPFKQKQFPRLENATLGLSFRHLHAQCSVFCCPDGSDGEEFVHSNYK
eukprot:5104656-Amphidinium_carterae.1